MKHYKFLRFIRDASVPATFVALAWACAGAALAVPTITNLGTLPGDWSSAYGVSGDGSVVIGESAIDSLHEHAFRWTSAEGMLNLGAFPGDAHVYATGISSDGSVIIGYSTFESAPGARAFRWTSASGMQDLGALPGALHTFPSGVSSDGSLIIGQSFLESGHLSPFCWTAAGGIQELGIGSLPEGGYVDPTGLSGDGTVVVGTAVPASGRAGDQRAFRWTASEGIQNLGTLPGGLFSQVPSVSADGSVVVGEANPAGLGVFTYQAFRWTSAGGMQNLGTLPGGTHSTASGVSGDGSVVVGSSSNATLFYRPFLWTASLGMVDLNSYLPTLGVDLTGWDLVRATAISADGSAIVGVGYFNGASRAWLVTGVSPAVPEPAAWVMLLTGMLALFSRRRVLDS